MPLRFTIGRRAFAGLTAALAGVAVAACASSTPTAAGSRLVLAIAQEPNSLDALFLEGPSASLVTPLIYSMLLTVDENGGLVPDLARMVPSLRNGGISRDGLTITYHLRPGIRWQDGVALDASDVAFTYAAIMNPKNNVPSRFGYDQIRGIDVPDAHTVRVHLRRPYAPILSLFMAPDQNFAVLPRHLLARYADLNDVPYNASPVGSGPYQVAAWSRGDRLRLVRNAGYFGGLPRIAEIDVKFLPDAAATLNQLRTGEVDADPLADPSLLGAYLQIDADRVTRTAQAGFGMLLFNTQAPIVSDARVRRALVASIDIPRIVRNATKGAQTSRDAGRGVYGWAYDPSIAPPSYDPAAAARGFDAAGWRLGADGTRRNAGRPLALDFAFPTGNGVIAALAVALQQEFHAAGVTLTLRPYAPAFFRAPAASGGPLFGGKFGLAFFDVFGSSDPDTHWLLGCSEVAPHGFNAERYCDPAIEAAQRAGASTYDRAARLQAYAAVQRRVASEVPFVPLYQSNAVNVFRRDVRGFAPSPLSPAWNVAAWSLAR